MLRSFLAAAAAAAAVVHGTPHADRLDVSDGRSDAVTCGRGPDVVVADLFDEVAADCETVSFRIAVDRLRGPAQHPSAVEPSAAAAGSTVVSVFQVGRFEDGGAEAIGFSTTRDAGRTWRSGLLPRLTVGGGPWPRASDPVVAWDGAHGVWLAAALVVGPGASGLTVSRSTDGIAWSAPLAADQASGALAFDKEWLTCDEWPSSAARGSCYLAWTDVLHHAVDAQVSHDGGLTWSAPVQIAASGEIAQPVVLPDGTIVVVYLVRGIMFASRSGDGGVTWSPPLRMFALDFAPTPGLRVPPIPSIAVDGGGRIVLAWGDCRFTRRCFVDEPVFSTSTDGLTWTRPRHAAVARPFSSAAVVTVGAGPAGRLALTYYEVSPFAGIEYRLLTSRDGGARWSPPRPLDARPMLPDWLPETEGGRFLGDYEALPFLGAQPLPIFALAPGPHRQALFATTVLR